MVVSLVARVDDSAGDLRRSPARVNVTGPVSAGWSRNGEGTSSRRRFALRGKFSVITDRVTLAHSLNTEGDT